VEVEHHAALASHPTGGDRPEEKFRVVDDHHI